MKVYIINSIENVSRIGISSSWEANTESFIQEDTITLNAGLKLSASHINIHGEKGDIHLNDGSVLMEVNLGDVTFDAGDNERILSGDTEPSDNNKKRCCGRKK